MPLPMRQKRLLIVQTCNHMLLQDRVTKQLRRNSNLEWCRARDCKKVLLCKQGGNNDDESRKSASDQIEALPRGLNWRSQTDPPTLILELTVKATERFPLHLKQCGTKMKQLLHRKTVWTVCEEITAVLKNGGC